jgi:hypothetical protein
MSQPQSNPARREVYCVLSARSLPYARHALESLFANSMEVLNLRLITDGEDDKVALIDTLHQLQVKAPHLWQVFSQAEADAIALERLAAYPNIAAFRFGHPCWRKITDPLLFAAPGEEMVILDPDLYFPNRFRFEPTLANGLLLMYQPPSCLLPPETVLKAYDGGVRLAHHVDIGVAQVRNNLDLPWLDALILRLGGKNLPRAMHVEAIVWAALAMHMGGGYLDPEHWHCWRNSQWKRVLQKLGASGRRVLRLEDFSKIKCFHGGGVAKWWVAPALAAGDLPRPVEITASRQPKPFEELGFAQYNADQRLKRWARRVGYYRLVKS